MKFTTSIDIDRPLDVVAAYFADPQYLKEYQDGFVNKELVSGNAGEEGAVSNMFYKQGKRELEIKETITLNNLPHRFEGRYEHKHMDNTMKCSFTSLGGNQTRYESEIEYTRMSWIMPKLMAMIFPGMFKKQVEKWMENFKTFVEQQ